MFSHPCTCIRDVGLSVTFRPFCIYPCNASRGLLVSLLLASIWRLSLLLQVHYQYTILTVKISIYLNERNTNKDVSFVCIDRTAHAIRKRHFQEHFNYIVAINIIDGGNWSACWDTPNFYNLLTNFITQVCIVCSSSWAEIELTTWL